MISLKTAIERREHIKREFDKQGLNYAFFDALSPADDVQVQIEKFSPNLHKAELSAGEKCCFLSHLLLWNKCLTENLPYIVIFEDDVCLSQNAHLFLKDDGWLRQRFDLNKPFILRLETYLMPASYTKTNLVKMQQYAFSRAASPHYGLAGYIISKQAVENLLSELKTLEDVKPLDVLIFNYIRGAKLIDVYQLEPAICIQENVYNQNNSKLGSWLDVERKNVQHAIATNRKKDHWARRAIRRFKRNIAKLHAKYTNRIVPFG